MSGNLENERSVSNSKVYPIDLVAPQKITLVKNVTNSDVKTGHVVSTQTKSSGTSQIITHGTPLSLMRPSSQIVSSNVQTQVSQIVSQSSQIISQGSQIINQSPMLTPGSKTLSPGTQIISQGTQLGSHAVGAGGVSQQILNVGGQLVSGSNLVVSSTVRAIPQSVRVLPPMQHITRPVVPTVSISNNLSNMGSGVVVSKTISSHVPRGPAVGASLTVPRVATRPVAAQTLPLSSLGNNTGFSRGVRGAVVYSGRVPRPMSNNNTSLAPVITLPSTLLNTNSVITGTVRATAPRAVTPTLGSTPRPLSLQKNYQPTKIVGVSQVGTRPPVGNSAPSQLYYEVTRNTQRPVRPQHMHNAQPVSVVNPVRITPEERSVQNSVAATVVPRPPILRKRDVDESPPKASAGLPIESRSECVSLWDTSHNEDNGGSTTESATSSPAPDEELSPMGKEHKDAKQVDAPVVAPASASASPRKKPRKQLLTNEVRQCEYQADEAPPTPPPSKPPPKRPTLSSSYVCGWRATALHFTRPTDVKRKEPRPRDLVAIASQKHVLAMADGWKVHHITNMMDDLVAMESDVGEQLSSLLQSLETTPSKAQTALAPHSHALLELVKGNIQRSKIVSEGIQEAREDILRVFTHRTFVAGILTRQADKRCFRKHRSQS